MRKTARPVVWEGAGAQSPAPDPIGAKHMRRRRMRPKPSRCPFPSLIMDRIVEPEWLDGLPVDDPRALRSRQDLRRVNVLMGHARILSRLLRRAGAERRLDCLVDLGAGDGTFLLELVKRLAPKFPLRRIV